MTNNEPNYYPPPGYGQPPPYYYPPYPYPYPPPYYPPQSTLGGKGGLIVCILLIIGGIIALLSGIYFILMGLLFSSFTFIGYLGALYTGCGIFAFVAGFLAIIGSIFAYKRQKWGFVIAATVMLIIGYGFIIGILALIFAILAKDEFR
jgi:hypothetical protein